MNELNKLELIQRITFISFITVIKCLIVVIFLNNLQRDVDGRLHFLAPCLKSPTGFIPF